MYALYCPPPFNINLPDHSFGELALLFPNTDIDIVHQETEVEMINSYLPLICIQFIQYVPF